MEPFLEPFKHTQLGIVFTNVKYSFPESDKNLDLQKTCFLAQIYSQIFLILQPSADLSPEQMWKIPLGVHQVICKAKQGCMMENVIPLTFVSVKKRIILCLKVGDEMLVYLF